MCLNKKSWELLVKLNKNARDGQKSLYLPESAFEEASDLNDKSLAELTPKNLVIFPGNPSPEDDGYYLRLTREGKDYYQANRLSAKILRWFWPALGAAVIALLTKLIAG